MKVAAITRTFDQLDLTRHHLRNLLRLTPEIDLLVIVDGYCEEDLSTREYLRRWNTAEAEVVKIFLDKPWWTTYCLNRGFERIPRDYDHVLVLDNDVFPFQKNWLKTMIENMERDESVAWAAPIYCDANMRPNDFGYLNIHRKIGHLVSSSPYQVVYSTGSCVLLRTKHKRKIGPWLESLLSCIEITEGNKFWKNGFKVIVDPRVRVIHLRGYTKRMSSTLNRVRDRSSLFAEHGREYIDNNKLLLSLFPRNELEERNAIIMGHWKTNFDWKPRTSYRDNSMGICNQIFRDFRRSSTWQWLKSVDQLSNRQMKRLYTTAKRLLVG